VSDDIESRLVWILGGPRTGSTWLLELLCYPLAPDPKADGGSAPRAGAGGSALAVPINEPYVGVHLDPVVAVAPQGVFTASSWRVGDSNYFFDPAYEAAWQPPLRSLLLARFGAQAEAVAALHGLERPLVVVKEPNGSEAAPLIGRVLPRSRILFLLRDGRDVLDSQLDAVSPGSWLAGASDPEGVGSPAGRMEFLRRHALMWLQQTDAVQRAVGAHAPELTLTVRYEDLRADTSAELARIGAWLGLYEAGEHLDRAAAALSFEAVPAEAKGAGKALRFASPGRWRENLSPEEQAAMLEMMGPRLAELDYEA
jgi:hypothetical protein